MPRKRRLLLNSMELTGSGVHRILAEAITDRKRDGITGTARPDGTGLRYTAFPFFGRSSGGLSSCRSCRCFSGCFCSSNDNDNEMKSADMHSLMCISCFFAKKEE